MKIQFNFVCIYLNMSLFYLCYISMWVHNSWKIVYNAVAFQCVNSVQTSVDIQVNVLPGVDPPAGQLGDDQPSAAAINSALNTALASSGVSVCTNCTTSTCSQFAVVGSSTSLNAMSLQQGIINAFSQANSLTSSSLITGANFSASQLTSVWVRHVFSLTTCLHE